MLDQASFDTILCHLRDLRRGTVEPIAPAAKVADRISRVGDLFKVHANGVQGQGLYARPPAQLGGAVGLP